MDLQALVQAALALALAACWSTPKPEPVTTVKPSTKPLPCPSAPELAAIAKTVWGTVATEDTSVEVLCIPLRRNGKAHFWLEGPAPKPEEQSHVPTGRALIDEHRAVVWKGREEVDSFGYVYNGGSAHDLDGDGNDEVLYERTTGEGGMSRNELVIVHFAPAPKTTSITLGMSGGGGEQTCNGSWSFLPHGRGKLIDVTRKGNSCDPKEAHQRYDSQGNELP